METQGVKNTTFKTSYFSLLTFHMKILKDDLPDTKHG